MAGGAAATTAARPSTTPSEACFTVTVTRPRCRCRRPGSHRTSSAPTRSDPVGLRRRPQRSGTSREGSPAGHVLRPHLEGVRRVGGEAVDRQRLPAGRAQTADLRARGVVDLHFVAGDRRVVRGPPHRDRLLARGRAAERRGERLLQRHRLVRARSRCRVARLGMATQLSSVSPRIRMPAVVASLAESDGRSPVRTDRRWCVVDLHTGLARAELHGVA
jgi:hypothetical protein